MITKILILKSCICGPIENLIKHDKRKSTINLKRLPNLVNVANMRGSMLKIEGDVTL